MDLSFMQNEIVLALCWTLIHSLWQGLLLAAVTGAVMVGTRKSSAGKRYRLLTGLFFLFMAVTAVTFVREYTVISRANTTVLPSVQPSVTEPDFFNVRFTGSTETVSKPVLERFKDYFNTHASLIVLIWFVIFIARFIRLAANLVYINRLKHYKTFSPPAEWDTRIGELVAALGLRKKIRLLESGIVKVPVVMGVLKPVVLLPLGLLSHLPAEEIEAILLHELAHIQRRDYLVNLVQNFAETIFFFNPALMWVSSMIREERENCCDDIAISVTNSKSRFINALIAFQEYNFSKQPAVGFAGRKNQLLNRVKRIVNEKNKTLNAAEKSVLTFAMGVFILFSFAAAKKIAPPAVKTVLASLEIKPDERAMTLKQSNPRQSIYDTVRINRKSNTITVEGNVVVRSDADNNRYTLYANMVKYTDLVNETGADHTVADTVPGKTKTLPLRLSNRSVFGEEHGAVEEHLYPQDSISKQFTNISSNSTNGGEELTVTASHKDGTEYRFKKAAGVLKEFSINGKATDPGAYMQVINDIENAISYRRARTKERHEQDMAKRNAMRDLKNKNMEERRTLDRIKRESGIEQRKHLSELRLQKLAMEDDSSRAARLKPLKLKLRSLDSANWINEKKLSEIKNDLKSLKEEVIIEEKIDEAGIAKGGQRKFEMKTKWDAKATFEAKVNMTADNARFVKEAGRARLKQVSDSMRSAVSGKILEQQSSKREWMRIQSDKDRARREENTKLILSIISDLEKEGVKIDLQKSWIALDKKQFVVDGKQLPKEIHEKFIAKYVTSADGLGYYYGPIQVRGRGIIFEYRDLAR
ncbi:M48 family metalloprotease [Sediminibacterium roseum]|uniref:M48 family metalloprotease n=1 Tax=Sediminibacterium roseum TaxID=1978412 RepID=A0ABW9ZXT4_9BACT|nr:M56 family metallopeptidase [Sediminibacterium roseum]NCI50863.1 M48 family metalloprotease [Sediminibacterium roseum]